MHTHEMFLIICSLSYSIVLDYHLAEDIAQETFISVGNNIHQYKQMGNGFSWVYTIAKNIALNNCKKNKNEFSADDLYLQNKSDAINFENQVEEKEHIDRLLIVLSETDREIVVLHLMSGLKHKEIAKMLNIPLGTVLSKYYRSITKLKNITEAANE